MKQITPQPTRGRPRNGKPLDKRLYMLLTSEEHQRLKLQAFRGGKTISDFVRQKLFS